MMGGEPTARELAIGTLIYLKSRRGPEGQETPVNTAQKTAEDPCTFRKTKKRVQSSRAQGKLSNVALHCLSHQREGPVSC